MIPQRTGQDTDVWTCGCSIFDGPCDAHSVVLVVRDGAAVRTADQLLVEFLADAHSLDTQCLSAYGWDVFDRARAALLGESWFDDDGLRDEVTSVVYQVEEVLLSGDWWVTWSDGYVIRRVLDNCPLVTDLE